MNPTLQIINNENKLPLANRVVILGPLSYKVGNITIPGDIKLFNQMWLNKEFDAIKPADLDTKCIPAIYRGDNCFVSWDTLFFTKRKELTYMSASNIWNNSNYPMIIIREVYKLLHTSNPMESFKLDHYFPKNMVQNYLSVAPETLMFAENKPIVFNNPRLLPIYRELIARFQLLGNRTNDERISIYLDELERVGNKIRFIQTLCYYGINAAIMRFKILKNNHRLEQNSEMPKIMMEPTSHLGFWKTGFRKAMYDLYSLCMSSEKLTPNNNDKIFLIWTTVKHYDKIRRLIFCYQLPLRSTIRQDKLHTISCHIILSYLGSSFIAKEYIVSLLESI